MTEERDDGGQAFPNGDAVPGMSLRDYYAGQAMQGIVASDGAGLIQAIGEGNGKEAVRNTAQISYALADAMLEARKR